MVYQLPCCHIYISSKFIAIIQNPAIFASMKRLKRTKIRLISMSLKELNMIHNRGTGKFQIKWIHSRYTFQLGTGPTLAQLESMDREVNWNSNPSEKFQMKQGRSQFKQSLDERPRATEKLSRPSLVPPPSGCTKVANESPDGSDNVDRSTKILGPLQPQLMPAVVPSETLGIFTNKPVIKLHITVEYCVNYAFNFWI